MSKKLNKLVVVDSRMINTSGIGRYIQAIIPALIENFKGVTLLGAILDIEKFDWANKVSVVQLTSPIYSISEQAEIILKTPACDVFLSPHYNVPILLPQAKKIAVIIPDTNHLKFASDLSFIKRIYAKLFFKIAVKKDIIFTISEFSKSEIVKYTNCDPDKIKVCTLAIDKEKFKILDQQLQTEELTELYHFKKCSYILYIGNVKPHKNLKRALLAFELVEKDQPGLRFLIVGKKDNFLTGDNEVIQLVENNENLRRKVDFTGHVSDLHLAFLYKNAKVFLFPSLYEGFGLPPLEAMFFGCPVIVSREGSLPEICGDAAYYCNAYNVENITDSIKQVILNDDLSSKLIKKGYLKVNEYDWFNFTNIVAKGLTSL